MVLQLTNALLARREGASGLVCSVMSLIQAPGDQDRFSVSTFFIILTGISIISFVAAMVLHRQLQSHELHSDDVRVVLPTVDTVMLKRTSTILFIMFWGAFINFGILISLTPYVTGPLKHAGQALVYATALVTAVDPIASFLTMSPRLRSQRIVLQTVAWTVLLIPVFVMTTLANRGDAGLQSVRV